MFVMYFFVSYYQRGTSLLYKRVRGDTYFDIWSKINYYFDDFNFMVVSINQVSKSTFEQANFDELL